MNILDAIVLIAFLAGLVGIGFWSSKRMTNSADMFSAGGKSPWWISGISAYMTMFSAGTFVVWGGVAYRLGVVAITVCMSMGIAALIAGYFFAGKWKESGATSAAEFVGQKYGQGVLQMYTWLGIITRIIGVSVALYSVAVIVNSLLPQAPDSVFADDNGFLSVNWLIIIVGTVIILYTFLGGLWAVLLTDFTQFVILMLSVCLILPMIYSLGGGGENILAHLPEGHLSLFSSNYTQIFIFGWILVHVFKVGGEWAFVQRHLCVESPKDARKASYLFGALYIITPVLWMLPPIIYRTINPDANPEQAYILSAQAVLPVGMLGLVVSSMLAATASMASSELNVFSGALTTEFYGKHINPQANDEQLLTVGRLMTIMLGILVIGISIAIPYLGGAEKLIVSITSLFVGPMVMPTLWALFVGKVTKLHAYLTVAVTAGAGILLQFVLAHIDWVAAHMGVMNQAVGLLVPVAMLLLADTIMKKKQLTVASNAS
ncbi:sodium:solute symporter family transporter [Photobacterium lutimaris]|uniref:Na+:solute symporter n=1 Tax=Photobacterium lutimaris TaxID=388278 RepID=A0A2T3IYB4_9GAMM|nr:Na+:solute symporter [Photobacterium lutimaris]PSU33552.1 Na+:solute symporter [Photobacterium lutimaris]TDR74609.1 Na+/proline symporter [Photobacterium lutimaris]